jgi:hypothetical protein
MLPTFIIAGALKSGTSTLFSLLKTHSEVCTPHGLKETNFFIRQGESARYDKGLSWYQSLFQACAEAKAIGEASPAYMTDLDAPALIHQTIPKTQLIFILRDPVERLYSHYWFMTQKGEQLPRFEKVMAQKPPEFLEWAHASQYDLHLKRYLELFPSEQVGVFLLDDLRSEPRQFIRGVYQFIGVDPAFVPTSLGERRNTARQTRVVWLNRWMRAIGFLLMKLDLPTPALKRLQKMRRKLWLWNNRPEQYPALAPVLREQLIHELEPTIAFVETYLGRPLPCWREVVDHEN